MRKVLGFQSPYPPPMREAAFGEALDDRRRIDPRGGFRQLTVSERASAAEAYSLPRAAAHAAVFAAQRPWRSQRASIPSAIMRSSWRRGHRAAGSPAW